MHLCHSTTSSMPNPSADVCTKRWENMNRDGIDRLAELRHPQVDHQCGPTILTSLASIVPPPDKYNDAPRHRLGCMFIPEAITCHCCKQLADAQCVHAGRCATSEASRGHYAVARTLLAVANTINPSAKLRLRPKPSQPSGDPSTIMPPKKCGSTSAL